MCRPVHSSVHPTPSDCRKERSRRSGGRYKFATLSGTSPFQSIFRTVRACTKMHVAVNSSARLGLGKSPSIEISRRRKVFYQLVGSPTGSWATPRVQESSAPTLTVGEHMAGAARHWGWPSVPASRSALPVAAIKSKANMPRDWQIRSSQIWEIRCLRTEQRSWTLHAFSRSPEGTAS
jgi:hypothetical protein